MLPLRLCRACPAHATGDRVAAQRVPLSLATVTTPIVWRVRTSAASSRRVRNADV